ncbi:hypothetical protein [Deinococcus sp.]|uniref:hypothetical protein n=1 Tax=Deinococcus sp. TaxID=47478 RepID=UPI003C7BC497
MPELRSLPLRLVRPDPFRGFRPARFALALLLSTLPALSPAAAQTVGLNVAGSLNTSFRPGVSLGLTFRNVTLFGGYGVSARLLGDIGAGGGLELSGVFDVPLDPLSERLTFYGGPGVALTLTRPVRLRPSLIAGLAYDLDGQLSLFGEAAYQWQGQFRTRIGLTYLF